MVSYSGLDPNSELDRRLLRNIQGNILKGHGRDHAAYFLLRFGRDDQSVNKLRNWLRNLPITSAEQQLEEAKHYRRGNVNDSSFISFYLSAQGYRALGYPEAQIPHDIAFRNGMKSASHHRLGDPPVSRWSRSYQNEIHALLLIANDNKQILHDKAQQLSADIITSVGKNSIATTEIGVTLRNLQGQAIEHFGYVDGLSQPLFFKQDIEDYRASNQASSWDASANPFHLVLVEDTLSPGNYGSYLVFRKLAQDVVGFEQAIIDVSRAVGIDKTQAAAMIVGRFKDSTPIVLSDQEQSSPIETNDFTYEKDLLGAKCPFHAHIRKLNPRTEDPMERARRIVRRGIPYEALPKQGKENEERGLLFQCFQQDISRQFEFLQIFWANNPLFPPGVGNVGLDPIAGQHYSSRGVVPQLWPSRWGDSDQSKRFFLKSYVALQGGEYFFAPSINFFKEI